MRRPLAVRLDAIETPLTTRSTEPETLPLQRRGTLAQSPRTQPTPDARPDVGRVDERSFPSLGRLTSSSVTPVRLTLRTRTGPVLSANGYGPADTVGMLTPPWRAAVPLPRSRFRRFSARGRELLGGVRPDR